MSTTRPRLDRRTQVLTLALLALLWACASCRQGNARPPRYVFVDGGAHLGETIEHFLRSPLHPQHEWEMFSFEANPNLIPQIPRLPRLTVLNQAIWVHDEGVSFYLGEETLSSSILGHKKTGNLSRTPVQVASVDFGRWLRRNFHRDDFILVKLDIEGAEYDVLGQMLRDGSIDWVDELYVEFHNVKVDVPVDVDRGLVREIEARGIRVKDGPESEAPGDWFAQ